MSLIYEGEGLIPIRKITISGKFQTGCQISSSYG